MSDSESLKGNARAGGGSHASPPHRPGMFRDPLVRKMTLAALGLVILFLATVLGALVTGVGTPDSPRTIGERELLIASAGVKAGQVGAAWAPYINALVSNGDLRTARVTLDTARASAGSTSVPELELCEARLEIAQKRYSQAAKAADRAMKGFEARRAVRLRSGGDTATVARETAMDPDYYDAALVKAYAHVGLREWKDAVRMFDVYIAQDPTSADVLVDRGNAKASLKDNAGAEKDFRDALRFVPYDKQAQAGLKRIGAAK